VLTKLNIQNYALIEDVSIDFSSGLTTITGETGAGKSILLGGLGLVLGKRAGSNSLLDPLKKCIIEAEFSIATYHLQDFFSTNDLDYEANTIIRRELLPSGKSRAFINDTPVRLEVLDRLKTELIDVHSQHQTLQLNATSFQFQLLDARAGTLLFVQEYRILLKKYHLQEVALAELKQGLQEEVKQHDYHLFLFEELEKIKFKKGEQETLEIESEKGNNIELIQHNISASFQLISNEELGVLQQLNQLKNNLSRIKDFDPTYKELYQRIASLHIEMDDIDTELSNITEQLSYDPNQIALVNNRLETLYTIFQKHGVTTIEDLLKTQESLAARVNRVTDSDKWIREKEKELENCKEKVAKLGKKISKKRLSTAKLLEKELVQVLNELGMPYAQFQIELSPSQNFYDTGIDQLQFLFNANKGGQVGILKQIASGGELSRLMLAFKAIMAKYSQLPTLIFDEIDSGISGEIALKMADIMKQMSRELQVISITHIPQIAAMGIQQMKVFKQEKLERTQTDIRLLSDKERVLEIAEMLGGKVLTETALNHAQQLLN